MIEPASLADWITFAVMTACLGASAALGYRWVLVAPPAMAATRRAVEGTEATDRGARAA